MTDNNQDFDLIHKFLEGDESSFNRLVKKYQDKIYWHARRMTGNHFDADEIMQEVLFVMYKKLNSFKFESSVYSWIYKITVTRSLNYIKKRNVKNFFSLDMLKEKSGRETSMHQKIEQEEEVGIIEAKLQRLPPKQREVFIMRSFNELSYEEIAAITGKSVGALKANYFHALNKIKDLLKDERK